MLVGVDGALALLFYPRTLSLTQGADTVRMDDPDVLMLGEPRGGMVRGQFRNVGVMAVPGPLDVERPFDVHFDLRPGMGLYSTTYPPPRVPEPVAVEEAPPAEDAGVVDVAAAPTGGAATGEDVTGAAATGNDATDETATGNEATGNTAVRDATATDAAATGRGHPTPRTGCGSRR